MKLLIIILKLSLIRQFLIILSPIISLQLHKGYKMRKTILITSLLLIGATHAEARNMSKLKEIAKDSVSGVVTSENLADAGKVIAGEVVAVTVVTPAVTTVAVSTAGALGATASTGTAIASLSGAAATSATLATIGSGVAGVVGVTVASPAIVGGLIVAGVSSAIVAGVMWLGDDE
jgi:hypothetical protein